MDFERSTQAKSWLFNEESLATCRAKAVIFRPDSNQRTKKARKFASGFHKSDIAAGSRETGISSFSLNVQEQECMIHFHAHHIQTLVGPAAVLDDLRTSVTVLSTAITYFRRFYLSNSVLEFNPRKMAVACAFFAAKVEEEKVEVSTHFRWFIESFTSESGEQFFPIKFACCTPLYWIGIGSNQSI